MSRILIAGCGYVGTALAAELAARGHRVWGLRRSAGSLPGRTRALRADVTRPETLDVLPDGLDAVVYAVSSSASTEAGYRSAYVEGIGHLLAALERRGARPARVLYVSSTAVYGETEGGWVDESSPTEPRRFRGRVLLEGEAAARAGPFPATVVRFGGIYGPGRARLVRRVRSGEARCPPDPPSWTNRIHRDDCAGVLHHLLELDDPEPVYLGVDREPAERCRVLRWIARRLGAPEPARADADGDDGGRRRTNKRCSSARLTSSGYAFTHPTFREGYGALIAAGEGADA